MRLGSIALLMAGSTFAFAQTGAAKPDLPTVFVAGDSTANNGDRLGWGDPFVNYF